MINNRFWLFFFNILFFSSISFAKKTVTINYPVNLLTKEFVNKTNWFKVLPVKEILVNNPNVVYRSICESVYFDCSEFSIAPEFPHKGYFNELFILLIKQARVQGRYGHIFINNQTPQELIWSQRYYLLHNLPKISETNIQKITGKVAVIAQFGYNNYFHWINEILGRLAILEIAGIKYDWLYVPCDMKYAKKTLELWGIDSSKIISPKDDYVCIQADELIVPSLVSNTTVGHHHAGTFIHPVTMKYVREKLLNAVIVQEGTDLNKLPKKIFISRKDSYTARKILNEDEIFELLKNKGFVRYELTKLSVAEQILLFYNAEIIASEQGSGLSNILFCKPQTKIIEIFQAIIDNCFWWQSYSNNLQYFPYMTIPVDTSIFSFCDFGKKYQDAWKNQVVIPIEFIKKYFADIT